MLRASHSLPAGSSPTRDLLAVNVRLQHYLMQWVKRSNGSVRPSLCSIKPWRCCMSPRARGPVGVGFNLCMHITMRRVCPPGQNLGRATMQHAWKDATSIYLTCRGYMVSRIPRRPQFPNARLRPLQTDTDLLDTFQSCVETCSHNSGHI